MKKQTTTIWATVRLQDGSYKFPRTDIEFMLLADHRASEGDTTISWSFDGRKWYTEEPKEIVYLMLA